MGQVGMGLAKLFLFMDGCMHIIDTCNGCELCIVALWQRRIAPLDFSSVDRYMTWFELRIFLAYLTIQQVLYTWHAHITNGKAL